MMNTAPHARRTILSWAFFDFGNSAFATLVVTFIYSVYFTEYIAPPSEGNVTGTALWSHGIAFTAIVVALLSPVLGALADRGGFRKLMLAGSTAVCVGATAMLYFPLPAATLAATGLPDEAVQALVWFVTANIAFEMGIVFYNAFLPEIAPPDRIGRVSGFAYALGYIGGLSCMVVAFTGFVFPQSPWFGLTKETGAHVRATNLLVAGWFALFALPLFLFVREDRPATAPSDANLMRETKAQLWRTFHEIRRYRQIVRLLAARLFYNDGLVTIFAFGGIYAAGTFGFSIPEIIIFGIALNVTSCLGAYALGFLDDRIGGRKTLLLTLAGLSVATTIGVIAPNKTVFWLSGILIGIFVGPNQSASRSLLGRFVPPDKENEFFGFFAFSGKATAFLGPLLFGFMTQTFASQRAGLLTVLLFFAIGAAILYRVDEVEGIALAGRELKNRERDGSEELSHPA